jgi:hypothetical protein
MATKDVPPRKPRRYLWPEEAVNIAQKKQHPVRLCGELMALTGYDKAACWRFLKKHGVERPGSGSRRTFDPTTVESIIEYVSEHGVRAASQRFHCEAKSLYNLIHRRGYTHYGKDLFSLRQICSHFGVRYSKVMSWIEQGLLKAKREQTRTGRPIYSIEFESLQKFCKEHRNLLITRRWPPQTDTVPGGVQLYLKFPDEKGAPRVALRGFHRVHLEPGATQKVHFDLKPRDLGMVTENGNPIIAQGDYTLSIGGGQPDTGVNIPVNY